MLHEAEHPFVTETPEEILQVRFQHPAHLAAGDYLVEGSIRTQEILGRRGNFG